MDRLDFWRLCDELTATQAALLIIGEEPDDELNYELSKPNISYIIPYGFEPVFQAIKRQVINGTIPAEFVYSSTYETKKIKNTKLSEHEICWSSTMIKVDDIKKWLLSKGIKNGFFFPEKQPVQDYLNKNHPHYSSKLVAAIHAWEAVNNDQELLKNNSAKQALEKWLRQHANNYGLTGDDGMPVNQAMEDISKVANWSQGGGMYKTEVRKTKKK